MWAPRPGADVARPGYLLPHRQTLVALGGLTLGMFVAAVNQTIVTTAMPNVVDDLGGIDAYSWVFSAFMLAMTVTVPAWGRLSDIYGRRPFFLAAIIILMLGAVIGATAQSMAQLIAARAVQGLAAGGLIPLAMATVGDLVPAKDRGRWQGLHGGVIGAAAIIGPLIGGWIADHADWRWVFLVTLPVALAALVVAALVLHVPRPARTDAGRTIDVLGGALLASGLLGFMVGIVEWGDEGRFAARAAVPLVLGLALLAVLVRRERRVADPFVPVELLDGTVFRHGSVVAVTAGAALFGATTFLPLYAQGALGASATEAGLLLMPLMLTMVVSSVASGQAISRTGRYRWAIVAGPPLIGASFAVLATMDVESSRWDLIAPTLVLGVGLGLINQNLLLVLQNSVSHQHLGVATGGSQLTRSVGGTVWIAAMGAVMVAGLGGSFGGADEIILGAGAAAREQLADALRPVFVITVPLLLLGWVAALRIPELPLRASVADEPDAVAVEAAH